MGAAPWNSMTFSAKRELIPRPCSYYDTGLNSESFARCCLGSLRSAPTSTTPTSSSKVSA